MLTARRLVAAASGLPRLAFALVLSIALLAGGALPANAQRSRDPRTAIHLGAVQHGKPVSFNLMGVNHRFKRNGYGVWDKAANAPSARVVRLMWRAGVSSLRFPGGTTATMYDWKSAIGSRRSRGCQIEGHGGRRAGFRAAPGAKRYGPDEFMEVIDASGGEPLIMLPFVNETPTDAADWVEYMNSPLAGNPNGGMDWADERARNGHPQPYGIRRWEVGNESHVAPGRYQMAADLDVAVRQYANGATRRVSEWLGRSCRHPVDGVRGTGQPGQVFEVLYRPIRLPSLTVEVGGDRWRQVPDLQAAGPRAHVYEADRETGEVRFGDGIHGAVPQDGARLHATYRNPYSGYFAFARAMKAVDPSIDVCASWGVPGFRRAAHDRKFDCLAAHPLTHFHNAHWSDRIDGHDRMMLGVAEQRRRMAQLLGTLPKRSPLLLTEFKAINGDAHRWPTWDTSMSHAVYMASMWGHWLRMGIRWGGGGVLLGARTGPVLGAPPGFVWSTQAVVRQAMLPMFSGGGHVVGSRIRHNVRRRTSLGRQSYSALTCVASRDEAGRLWVLVVNQHPKKAVQTRITFGRRSSGRADVREVSPAHFTSYNRPAKAGVRFRSTVRGIGRKGFTHRFSAHSVSVLRIRGA